MERLPENIRSAIKSIINKNAISDFKTEITPASNRGDNFIGTLYRIEVNGVKNGVRTKLNLICKVPPANSKNRSNMNIQACFEKEIFVYDVLLEHFKRFQTEKGLEPHQIFTFYALYYSGDATTDNEYLILEDLKTKSFEMFDRRKKLDRAHVQLFVEGIAKFHAISFAMKDQQPDKIKPYIQKSDNMLVIFGKKTFFDLCEFGLNQTLDVLEENCCEYKERVRKIKENCEDFIYSCYNGTEDYRVVAHGDCWNNNMLFKYENNTPVEICFLDWQITTYSSPVLDLSYYFYNSTEKELLNEHFDELMDLYHDHLCKSIRLLGSDPDILYPYEAFQRDWKQFGKYGIIIASFGLNFMLAKPEMTPDVGELADVAEKENAIDGYIGFKDEQTKSEYERKILDMIKHAGERDYL